MLSQPARKHERPGMMPRLGGSASTVEVALVAGATRGAGRAIAVELARAGFFVYATGRSSRSAGPSKVGRPEIIEVRSDRGSATATATRPALS